MEKRGMKSPATVEERTDLITKTHLFGHFGREAMFPDLYNKSIWWPGIRNDIAKETINCDACTRFVVHKRGYNPAQAIVGA